MPLTVQCSMPRVCIIGWSRTLTVTLPCARPVCAKGSLQPLGRSRPPSRPHPDYLRAVEDRREAMGVCASALPGAMRGGERVGERKNVPRDQEILILGAYRMPIYT